MATFEFNDQIKFMLPSGFMLVREEDEDGDEVVKILSGEYENDDGETCYKFSCNVAVSEFAPDDSEDDITTANLIDKLAERMEGSRRLKLPGIPEMVLMSKAMPITVFGRVIKMFAFIGILHVSDWTALQLVSVTRVNDDKPEENAVIYENMYEVLKAVRVNGKQIPVESVSPSMLQDALELSFDENGESIDLSPTIKFNITAGDETRTYEYTSEGMKQVDYDADSYELLSDKRGEIDCNINYAQMNDLHNELRTELLYQLSISRNYSYPETEDCAISGVFTEEPDFDALRKICTYAVEKSDSHFDGDWSAEQLYSFLERHIQRYHQGDRYNIYLGFGGALPILALLPFLAVSSKMTYLDVMFTHDKWEARGDYSCENHVGIKLSRGHFLVGKFEEGETIDEDEYEEDEEPVYNQYAADEWMNKYGRYVEKNPDIDFNGTLFVFSGLAGHWAEKDHPTVQKVIEKGGQYRSKVSGLTNYLVVNPADAGSSKIVAVMEQLAKGKNVKVILLSDLETALSSTGASKPVTTITAKQSAAKATSTPAPKGKKIPKKDCEIDDENRLISYSGTETNIILPQGIEIIGENAFLSSEIKSVVVPEGVEKIEDSGFWGCKRLKFVTLPSSLEVIEDSAFYMCETLESIVIPEGVTEIGIDAFSCCNKLKDIYLPDSLWDIGYDAFCTFCDEMTLHVPKNSDAETYAMDNDIKYDNKKAPAASAVSTLSGKSTAKSAPAAPSVSAPAKPAVRSTSSPSDFTIEKGVLTEYTGTATDIVIPAGVTKINSYVFYENKNMVSLVITEGVRTIGDCAFGYCPNLEQVTLPDSLEELAGFNASEKLAEINIPSNVRIIKENAFSSCDKLAKVIIPASVTTIEDSAFGTCSGLKDVYVPASVKDMHEYTFLGNIWMTMHTPAGSYAEGFAKQRNVSYDNNVAGVWSTTTKVEQEVGDFASAVSGLNAQIAELNSQEMSEEDRESLNKVMEQMNDIGDQLEQGQAQMDKYGDYLEQKEQREKAAEEEKDRLKAEALAAGKSEKDVVNMYVILTNEKKLGKLHRSADDFYETYEEDFAALSKAEVISTRKDMLEEMEDETLCAYYTARFKQRTVEDRFSVATRNLNNVSPEPELAVKAKWAIENTKEWYLESEFAEVQRLMDADLAHTRSDLDSQFDSIDSAWKKFSTGKEFLQIAISNKAADGSDLDDNFSNFQMAIGGQVVQVQLASKGVFRMSTTVMNCFTWYWGVTVRDIWEAAMKNNLFDEREGAYNGSQLANQAMSQIRAKYPIPAPSSQPTATQNQLKPSATPAPKATTQPKPQETPSFVAQPAQTPAPKQSKKGWLIVLAVVVVVAIIAAIILGKQAKDAPYKEVKQALDAGTFSAEWAESNDLEYNVTSKEGMKIVADKLRECRTTDDAETAFQIFTELFELGVHIDGKYYYASTDYVNWLKDAVLKDGEGTVLDEEYAYTVYGYRVKWKSSMMMNQLYLYVVEDDDWHIITVNNTYYNISSDDKVGI